MELYGYGEIVGGGGGGGGGDWAKERERSLHRVFLKVANSKSLVLFFFSN